VSLSACVNSIEQRLLFQFGKGTEMKISDVYANTGKALKAADITSPMLKIIGSVSVETIGQGPPKPVAKFTDGTRLILNQFNAFEISLWYGDDTAGWAGMPVELYPATTMYQGNPVPCVRVRRPVATSIPAVPVASAPSPVASKPGPAAPPVEQQQGLFLDVIPPPF
jgi:hypothetical protein